MSKVNGVYIIESLHLDDEEVSRFEGRIIKQMLELAAIDVKYIYIRTKKELEFVINDFESSNYRYLHLSCHGNAEGIGLTLEDDIISFEEFDTMFKYEQVGTRLILSACEIMKDKKIASYLSPTKFSYIAGPLENIYFNDATIFWASLYHLLFKNNENQKKFKTNVKTLSEIYGLKVAVINKFRKHYLRKEYSPTENEKVSY